MRCPNCGRDNADGVKFCQWCGAAFLPLVPPPSSGAGIETGQSMSSMFLAIGFIVVGLWALVCAATWWTDKLFDVMRYIDAGVGIILVILGILSIATKK